MMNKLGLCACMLSPILLLQAQVSTQEQDGWIQLFNGHDLTGWKANRAPDSFTVKDGVLTAHSTSDRSHLFYVGEDDELDLFKDFELVVVARGEPNANSGIFFHTDMALRDKVSHLANGYEVQLLTKPGDKHPTGSLYDIADLESDIVDANQWVELRIRVKGKRIQAWVNGKQTVDYTEPPNPERKASRVGRLLRDEGGAIALQAHDPDSIFHFREIRLREL